MNGVCNGRGAMVMEVSAHAGGSGRGVPETRQRNAERVQRHAGGAVGGGEERGREEDGQGEKRCMGGWVLIVCVIDGDENEAEERTAKVRGPEGCVGCGCL